MKLFARSRLIILVSVLVVVLAGCYNTRMGVSWASLAEIEVNGESQIAIAYNNRVDLVDPSNGALTPLRNTEGEIRYDEEGDARRWVLDGGQYENAQFFVNPLPLPNEMILMPAHNGRLFEVDLVTTRVEDADTTLPGQIIADVVTSEDMLYIADQNAAISAYDRETYDLIWTAPRAASIPEGTEVTGIWAAPLLHEGVLYIPTVDHYLYAVDAMTGESVWRQPLDLEGAVVSTPLYYNGFIYVGSFSHKLYKISPQGDIISTYEAVNWIWHTPVVYDNHLYITDLSGYVHAVDSERMVEVWARQIAERGIRSGPIVTEESVVAASRDGRIYWLDRADGTEVFNREIDGRPEILSDMLLLEANVDAGIDEPMVIVSTVDQGKLVASFTLENGRLNWVYGR